MTVKPLYPRKFPQNAFLFLLIGVACTYGIFSVWSRLTDPVTSSLIGPYIRCYYDADLPRLPSLSRRSPGPRTVHLASNVDVIPARAAALLRAKYFHGETPAQALFWPFTMSELVLIVSLIVGIRSDVRYAAKARKGVRIRGPILQTRREFTRDVKGDGIGLYLKNTRSPVELLSGQTGFYIRLKRRHEAQGRLIMGDIGTGKTSVAMQILDQAQDCGHGAIIYDPHGQFTPRYFNSERGDVILNPYDRRCPYYSPLGELDLSNRDAAWTRALSQGHSLYPPSNSTGAKPRDWFFTATSIKLWQHTLVNFQPEPHEMAAWMKNELEILMRVVGTELETMVPRASRDQRAAVLSTYAMIADALEQLPRREEGRPEWSIREWAKTRKGRVFLTATPETRPSLKPFHSLILDQAIIQIASMGERPDLPIVDVVIDEAQTLQRLPQLITLLTELRKFGMSPTISFQGRAQMKTLYEDNAEQIFGMPIVKYVFRTSDGDAAEAAEKMFGKVDLLQVKETRPIHSISNWRGGTYAEQEVTKPLVSAAELQGLPDLTGYMKYVGRVVKIQLPTPTKYRKQFGEGMGAQAFIPREAGPVIRQEVSPETAAFVSQEMRQRETRAPVPIHPTAPQPTPEQALILPFK